MIVSNARQNAVHESCRFSSVSEEPVHYNTQHEDNGVHIKTTERDRYIGQCEVIAKEHAWETKESERERGGTVVKTTAMNQSRDIVGNLLKSHGSMKPIHTAHVHNMSRDVQSTSGIITIDESSIYGRHRSRKDIDHNRRVIDLRETSITERHRSQ